MNSPTKKPGIPPAIKAMALKDPKAARRLAQLEMLRRGLTPKKA